MKLTQEQLAALAAGATLASLGLEETQETEEAKTARLAAEAATLAAEAETARLAAEAEANKTKPEVLAYVQGQLTAAQAETVELKVKLAQATEQLAATEGLTKIARASVGNMSMNLGGAATAGEAFSGAALVAEHARLDAVFKEKFKVGRVTATNSVDDKKPAKVEVDPLFLRVLELATK
jgi:hypothetical protein